MNTFRILALCTTFLFSLSVSAQNSKGIFFKSGEYQPQEIIDTDYNANELINGGYIRLIQFSSIPTNAKKNALAAQGITLLNYIPHNAFFAKLNVDASLTNAAQYGITSVEKVNKRFKLTAALNEENYPHWTLFGTDRIELHAIYFNNVDRAQAEKSLLSVGAEIVEHSGTSRFTCRVALSQLDALYALNDFYYFEELSAPAEPENIDGRTSHRSNLLATDYATGLKYDGTGVTIMMQDDGYIGEHIDYEGRIDQSNCNNCSWSDNNSHGDHVAGTIMGAGNLNPRYRGMAFGAELLVYSSGNGNFGDVPNLYANEGLVITSKSYSDGCNNGYTNLASELDEQVHSMPALTHVFSAGNNGTSDCSYGAGAGWGNITGGHKVGKNVIAVGNLTANDVIAGSSSRGPAHDGRIKPDICAVGTNVPSTVSDYDYDWFTGTSMACPGVAGTIGQLYHAYRDINGGANPNSALIKGAVLNTAEDLGNPGPDFIYGWGRINAVRAYEVLLQGNYLSSNIAQGATNNHSITVPSGVTKLKVMVYWTDHEAAGSSSIALVNDLNMVITDPGLASYNPFILDPTPDPTLLNLDAVTGVDALNNMEQISIDNPLPGSYSIDINGFAVPEGPQEYFITYTFERDDVKMTFPTGGEGFAPGVPERIRWDASEGTSTFLLEYTTDNGTTWNNIGTANADVRSWSWSPPSALTGEAKVRVTRGASSDESAAVFSIIEVPDNLHFAWSCPDSLNFAWDPVPGATSYEVYMLGTKYMDSIGTSTTNNLTIPFLSTDDNWFSVRAFGPTNARGERAVAIRKIPGQYGCTWSAPFAGLNPTCDSISSTGCVQIMNESLNVDGSSTYQWYFPTGVPTTSTDEHPTVCFASPGNNPVSLVVTNGVDSDSIYVANAVFVQEAKQLPYHEGFENLLTLNGQPDWLVYNPGINSAFDLTTTAALTGNQSVKLANHGQSNGTIDELISGPIDLSVLSATDDMTLSFRYAYKRRNSSSDDWLRVYAKNACDDTWQLRKTLHGQILSTEIQNTPWTPSDSSDWITVHVVNITASYFTGDFRFKFNFEGGTGNNFYLDDINIYAGTPSDQLISGIEESGSLLTADFYPNPADKALNIRFGLNRNQAVDIAIRSINGQDVMHHAVNGNAGSNLIMMDTEKLSAGVYFVTLSTEEGIVTKQLVIK